MNCESCGHANLDEARFCASCGIMLPTPGMNEHPWVGRLIGGRFRVTSVLGEGGMGVVYSGEQQMGSTVRRVAIKTLHPHLSQDPSVLARFHRECGTVAQLEHPNTIKVYDFGAEEDGTLYIAMEYVDGRSLDRAIEEEGALDPERVAHIIEQVCGALDEAHGQGIIHRDLKPENIILSERLGQKDFVKVLDFGIASRSESADAAKEQKLTQQGMVLGTPPYMSPEQFTGQALDRRSDIYSLGIMTYQMLTGRLPFSAATAWQWATEHMTAQPFPLEQTPVGSNVPAPMRQAVMRALAKLPEDRQETAGAFYREIAAGLNGAAESSEPQRSSTGTEAMPAAPVGAVGRTVPLQAAAAPGAPLPGSMGPAVTPAAMAAPPPPPRVEKGGGGKGLVVALGLLGAGLLVAIGVVAMRGDGDDDVPAPLAFENAAEPASVAPEVEVPPDVTADDPLDEPSGSEPASDPAPSKPSTPATPSTSKPSTPSTPSTPAPSTGGTSGSTPTPPPPQTTTPPPAPAPKDCSACLSAAAAGNIQGAVAALSSCDAAGQAQCKAAAGRQASASAASAAAAGRCAEAKQIVAAANAAGMTSGIARANKAIADNCT